MGKIKLLLITFVAVAMTLGIAGLASAATITCGACHSSPPVNSDNCTSNARALHGTHVNYSSTTFPKTVANYGKCAYCHPTGLDAKGSATLLHNNNFKNITGGSSAKAPGLRYTTAPKTCANACHKNDAVGTWGNYTATTVGTAKLSCGSCHDDSAVGAFAAQATAHNQHMLSNCTTPSGLMNQAANAGCAACHPDDRADLWKNGKADDGTKKAYPHATDGTNVSNRDLAVLSNTITSATKNGANTTCANTCHARTAVTWGTTYTAGGTASCNLCHYWAATPLDTNNTGVGSLSFGHNSHIKSGYQFACVECHPNRTDRDGHATKLPISGNYNINVSSANRPAMTYNKGAKTCTNTGGFCHGAGTTTAWGTTTGYCAACHYYPGATAGLGSTWATGNGHNVRHDFTNQHMKAGSFTGTSFQTDTFASAIADVNKCGLCHRNIKAKHPNGTNFAHLSSAAGYNTACGTFTFSTGGVGNGSTTTCANVKCHSGKTTPVWW